MFIFSRTLEWSYVVGIYEDTSYGILGFAEVTRRAELTGLCIAKEFKVKRYYKTEEEKYIQLYDIIEELDDFNNTEGTEKCVIFIFILLLAHLSRRLAEATLTCTYNHCFEQNKDYQHFFLKKFSIFTSWG